MKIEKQTLRVGHRAFTATFWKDRLVHPRLQRQRQATVVSLVNEEGIEIGFGYTMRNPGDKNNPTYAKNTAFRRAVNRAFAEKNIRPTTRVNLFKAFFSQETASAA